MSRISYAPARDELRTVCWRRVSEKCLLWDPPPGIQAPDSRLRRPSCFWVAQRCSAARVRSAAPFGAPLPLARRCAVGAITTGGSAGNQVQRCLAKHKNRLADAWRFLNEGAAPLKLGWAL